MNTLVIVSHPEINESGSQQYLLSAIPENKNITVHHLEEHYPDGKIDIKKEQELLKKHQRIIFQFPLYWYSSPPLLKKWQDEVLEDIFAFGGAFTPPQLSGKEFSIVTVIGAKADAFMAGGREAFNLDGLTSPFQAMAYKTGMVYIKPLYIHQFAYKNEEEKMAILIAYQQLLTMDESPTLANREEWMVNELEKTNRETLGASGDMIIDHAIDIIEDNRMTMDELQLIIDELNG